MNKVVVEPQPGPQADFLSSPADIAIYGGAAGGGKSYGLLIDPLRHYHNGKFGAVIFRRTTKQVRKEGALWDQALSLYAPLRPTPLTGSLEFIFPTGMKVGFGHLEHEHNIYDWQGSEIALIGFDELTHFTERQFFYMMSRNRSTCGVRPRIRATTNPDPDSWVRRFIDWWIGEDGFPIKERSGAVRWFIRNGDDINWADTKEELLKPYSHLVPEDQPRPKSVTFIPAKLSDNKIFVSKDPDYKANLEALSYVDRMQLLHGNWNVRPSAGLYFKRQWFEIVDAVPANLKSVRYWDRASSEKPEADWTAGVKMGKTDGGQIFIEDVCRFRGSPLKVQEAVKNLAIQDGRQVTVGIEQDPGQAGVMESEYLARLLLGFNVKINKVSKDKITRATPLSAQCEIGNVKLVRGKWNEDFIRELEQFPESVHDDQVDAASGAFFILTRDMIGSFTSGMAKATDIKRRGKDQW